jgi:hypothetical protein
MLRSFRQQEREHFISADKDAVVEGEITPVVTLERKEKERFIHMSDLLSTFFVTHNASPMFFH